MNAQKCTARDLLVKKLHIYHACTAQRDTISDAYSSQCKGQGQKILSATHASIHSRKNIYIVKFHSQFNQLNLGAQLKTSISEQGNKVQKC